MKQVLVVALLQFRLVLRNKGYLVLMFAMPLIITAVFALTAGGEKGTRPSPIAVVNQGAGVAARELVAALGRDGTLAPRVVAADQVDLLLADHTVEAALIVPADFSDFAPDLGLVSAPGRSAGQFRPAIARAAAAVTANYGLARHLAGANPDPAAIETAYSKVLAERQSAAIGVVATTEGRAASKAQATLQDRAAGFTVMFVMMVVLMMSGTILQERQSGTLGRICVSPVARAGVLGGYFLSFVMTGLFQFAVLVAASTLLFEMHWGPLLPLSATALGLILSTSGVGLLLAGLVKTAEQQRLVAVIVAINSAMLGGVYWPMSLMGSTMQRIGHLTPVAWAMDALQEVMLRGANWPALALPLAVLLGMALATTSVGLMRTRWE